MQYWIIKDAEKVKDILRQVYDHAMAYDYQKPAKLYFEQYRPTRSLNQNALSHVWYREIAKWCKGKIAYDDGTEFTEYDVKQMLKMKYLPTTIRKLKGKEVNIPVSTKNLDAGQMYDFMCRIQQWAHDKGIVLPVPEDSEFYKLMQDNN